MPTTVSPVWPAPSFVLAWSARTAVSRDRYLSRGFIVAPAMSYGQAQGLAVADDASRREPAAVPCIRLAGRWR